MSTFTSSDLEAANLLARLGDGGAPPAVTPPQAADGQRPSRDPPVRHRAGHRQPGGDDRSSARPRPLVLQGQIHSRPAMMPYPTWARHRCGLALPAWLGPTGPVVLAADACPDGRRLAPRITSPTRERTETRRSHDRARQCRAARIPHAAAAGAPSPIPAGPAFAAAQRWPRTRPARRYRGRGMAAMLAERTRCAPGPLQRWPPPGSMCTTQPVLPI